jgi:hypothetical protein
MLNQNRDCSHHRRQLCQKLFSTRAAYHILKRWLDDGANVRGPGVSVSLREVLALSLDPESLLTVPGQATAPQPSLFDLEDL